MAGWRSIATPGIVGVVLLLAGCQNIPYYDDSLGWFSWSEYDPEIRAIEAETPPPGALEAPAADGRGAFVLEGRGGYVWTDPPPGMVVFLGATPFASGSAIAAAGNADAGDNAGSGAPDPGSPLVGIRNSIGPSVTWRSTRGTP